MIGVKCGVKLDPAESAVLADLTARQRWPIQGRRGFVEDGPMAGRNYSAALRLQDLELAESVGGSGRFFRATQKGLEVARGLGLAAKSGASVDSSDLGRPRC